MPRVSCIESLPGRAQPRRHGVDVHAEERRDLGGAHFFELGEHEYLSLVMIELGQEVSHETERFGLLRLFRRCWQKRGMGLDAVVVYVVGNARRVLPPIRAPMIRHDAGRDAENPPLRRRLAVVIVQSTMEDQKDVLHDIVRGPFGHA